MKVDHDPLASRIFVSRRHYRNAHDTKSGKRRAVVSRLSASESRWRERFAPTPRARLGARRSGARANCGGFPGFDSLPAAQSGEIYLVNASAYFVRPGLRIVDSLEILAGILHPQEFQEFARPSSRRRVSPFSAPPDPSGPAHCARPG
jgi:hypothetical protein